MAISGNRPPENNHFCSMGVSRALEIAHLVDAIRALPDVRVDKVVAVRKAIETGTYVVDAAKIAQRMIDDIR